MQICRNSLIKNCGVFALLAFLFISVSFSCSLNASESDDDSDDSVASSVSSSSSDVKSALTNVFVGGSRTISATGSGTLTTALTFSDSDADNSVTYEWEIVSGEEYATLSATSGESVTITGNNGAEAAAKANVFTTASVTTTSTATESQTVVVKVTATCGSVSISETITITVAGSDETVEKEISDVNLSTRYKSIAFDGRTTLTALASYSGNPSIDYNWEIVSGGDYAELSAPDSTSGTRILTAKNSDTSSQTVTVKVTAGEPDDDENAKTSTVTVTVGKTNAISSVEIDSESKISAAGSGTLKASPSFTVRDNSESETLSYSWEITSGSEYAKLSSDSGESVTITGKNSESTSQSVTIKLTASYTNSVSYESSAAKTLTITVLGVPETYTWDFSSGEVTMYSNVALSASATQIQYKNGSVTGYLKGTSSGSSTASMKIETPLDGAKIAIRNDSTNKDAQVNAGALFYIPVSTGSVVTVNQRTSGEYELGGEESLTYTASKAGYVIYEAFSNHYLSTIKVTDVVADEAHTDDVVSFESKTDTSTANTTDVLGFTASSVSSSSSNVVEASLSGASVALKSVSAGTAVITASGSGSESVSWSVTVRRYGKIVVGGITPYSSAEIIESGVLLTSGGSAVNVQGGRVTTSTGSFVYYNKAFESGTKVRIEATTYSYTSGGKTLDVGFIENPSRVSSDAGIYTTASGANAGKVVGNSTNGWNDASSFVNAYPYTYICEYTVGGSSSDHYLYTAKSSSSDSSSYYSKTGVSCPAISSCYAIFGDISSEIIFTSIKIYADDALVYDSSSDDGKISSTVELSFLSGDSDLTVGCTQSGSSYTFAAKAPDSSASYTYAWYVDNEKQSGSSSTFTTTLTSGTHSILVTAEDSGTGVVYSAQYTLSVK